VVTVGLLAASALSIGSPAQAHFHQCSSTDPVLAYVCRTVGGVDPSWVQHYYDEVGRIVYSVYCTAWPPC
jgi:hypothetical protein